MSFAADINDSGTVLCRSDQGNERPAYLWSQERGVEVIEGIDRPNQTYPRKINNSGVAVGYTSRLVDGRWKAVAFRWTREDGMTDLGHPPGFTGTSSAKDVNESGWIVGTSLELFLGTVGWIWKPRIGMQNLGLPLEAEPNGLNDRGDVVGYWVQGGQRAFAFVVTPESGYRLLEDLLEPGSPSVRLTSAQDITNDGVILSEGLEGNRVGAYLLFPLR